MEILRESIQNMLNRGRKIGVICYILGIKKAKLRSFMLENDITPSKNDNELEYFKQAKIIKSNLNKAYFTTDLAKITGISISRVKMICAMYGLKPCKKAYCVVCGEEIDMSKSTVVKKYCSDRCYFENNRPQRVQKPLLKTCVSCGTIFEGKANSKFCSDRCRKYAKEVKESRRWLEQL